MRYAPDDPAGLFLSGDRATVARVVRWVSRVLASPTFWSLRSEWSDLHQEVMERLTESLRSGRFDPARDFRAYVQGVARFTGFKVLDRRRREPATPRGDEPGEPGAEPEGVHPERKLIARQLALQVLEASTAPCRELIVSYFVEGKSYRDIAEATGQPVGTVKSRLFRCLESVHRQFRKPPGGGRRRREKGRNPKAP